MALLRRVWRTEVRDLRHPGRGRVRRVRRPDRLRQPAQRRARLRLAKSASFTRWDDRPLSPEQLTYARDDVAHLLRLADALQERLAALGQLQWAGGAAAGGVDDERDPWLAWQRLPRIAQLNPQARSWP